MGVYIGSCFGVKLSESQGSCRVESINGAMRQLFPKWPYSRCQHCVGCPNKYVNAFTPVDLDLYHKSCVRLPRPPKGSKKWNPPNMNPLLHWGNKGIIIGLHSLDPLGGLGTGG